MAIDLLNSADTSGTTTDPSRPDYACPAYLAMAPAWSLVRDIREGTLTIRAKKERYLPKFEAETPKDWDARVAMSFVTDHYATTVEEYVGLVMSDPIKLGDDVPPVIRPLTEDIDGEGNHLDVFAQSALDAAVHLGHCVLLTDYPSTDAVERHSDEKRAKVRPYVQLYAADDVLSWCTASLGGVRVLTRITLRERSTAASGAFGISEEIRYREIWQDVTYDEFTGRATGLGAIKWRTWRARDTTGPDGEAFEETGSGETVGNTLPGKAFGPYRITARVVYGGQKLGVLRSKPHLYGLALSNLEETQVASDYANVMHKCNVPTPVFIGRNTQLAQDGVTSTLVMGQGIDIPIGGDAKMLEPSGAAIDATRQRLMDIQARMQRQGAATAPGEGGKTMTATEAAQYAKARNAKLARAARSLQDALEGVLADFAAFMGLPSGGSVTISQNFAGQQIDPAYLTVLVTAYAAGTLSIEEIRFAIQAGKLPETFDPDDVLEIVAREAAKQDAAKADAEREAARIAAEGKAA